MAHPRLLSQAGNTRVLVAPNAFKGSLTASAAADAIAQGLTSAGPGLELDLLPLSDGGDGFVDALAAATGATRLSVLVRGPVHSPVAAALALLTRSGHVTAIVEAAQSSGMALLRPEELDPLHASTGGLGEVLREARQRGAGAYLVGIGGSATTDGGTGMARALGYRFLDGNGAELPEGGGALVRLAAIDASGFDSSWLLLDIDVACDVTNPLTGPAGAAHVYGPQKGATPDQVELLDAGLRRLAEVCRRDLGAGMADVPGSGAAGGLGFGLMAFMGARLRPGAALVFEATGFERRLAAAAALVTGEGRLDSQSLSGKAPAEAGRLARSRGRAAYALVGSTGDGWEEAVGDAFDEVIVAAPPGLLPPQAMASAGELLSAAAATLAPRLRRP